MNQRVAIAVLCVFMLGSSIGYAHDLYLTPESGRRVCAGIGEHFPKSENAVTADRVNQFQLRTERGTTTLQASVTGKQFCAAVPAGNAAYVAELTVQPRFIRLPASDFNPYIHGEGLRQIEKARAERNDAQKDGREVYSRYAKIIEGKTPLATEPVGHALEIIPEMNPSALKAGDSLTVRVLFKGKPLVDAQVSATYAGAEMKGHDYPVSARTDADGKATLKLDRPGLWYARLIYMEAAQNDPEIDWRSYFATLTFTVPQS